MGRSPILPDACAVVIDEAHKLPKTARQMFGTTLDAQDIRSLIRNLSRKRFQLASESLSELVYHTMEDRRGGTMLCAVAADMTAQLRATLWSQDHPVILTSSFCLIVRSTSTVFWIS